LLACREKEKELNESYRQNAEQAKSLFDIMQQKTAALKEIEHKNDRYPLVHDYTAWPGLAWLGLLGWAAT
jgi:acetone carboxylase gamma subunit